MRKSSSDRSPEYVKNDLILYDIYVYVQKHNKQLGS